MNKLILCEGATDAILLSYYLERTAGWKFVRQPPQGVSIRATEQNEEVTWYKKNNDYLLICAVGGKDNFGKFFDDKIQKPLVMSDAFEKIAIVADRDNREVSEIETEASAFLKVPCGTIKNNQWNDCSYTNEFRMEKTFSALLSSFHRSSRAHWKPQCLQPLLKIHMIRALSRKQERSLLKCVKKHYDIFQRIV